MCVENTEIVAQSSDGVATWVGGQVKSPICKTNTPPRKDFQLAPINKLATSILSLQSCFNKLQLHTYHQIKYIVHFPISIPKTSERGKPLSIIFLLLSMCTFV